MVKRVDLRGLAVALLLLTPACVRSKTAPTAPPPVVSLQGGIDSGGGNFIGSEPGQIRAIFNGDHGFDLKKTVKEAFESIAFNVKNKNVSDELESIFSRMLGPKFSGDTVSIDEDITRSPYELKESGPCLNDAHRGFTDASAQIDQKFTTVCFSLDALKRFPIQAVPFQLVALAVHEHAHHYGFDEADAVKAQTEILSLMNRQMMTEVFVDAISTAARVRDHATQVTERLDQNLSDKIVCKHLSEINCEARRLFDLSERVRRRFETRMLVTALDFQFGLNERALGDAAALTTLSGQALAFCGDDKMTEPVWNSTVPEGDRARLKTLLVQLARAANGIVSQATTKR